MGVLVKALSRNRTRIYPSNRKNGNSGLWVPRAIYRLPKNVLQIATQKERGYTVNIIKMSD